MNTIRTLIVEYDRQLRHDLADELKEGGFEIIEADNAHAGLSLFKKQQSDVVITGIKLPAHREGLELVKKIKSMSFTTIIIALSEQGVEAGLEALQLGADDYFVKEYAVKEIKPKLMKHLRDRQVKRTNNKLMRENVQLHRELMHEFGFKNFVGESPPIQKVKTQLRNIADRAECVLVTGESGNGKEMVARALHYSSYRRKKPIIIVNCAGLPEKQLQEELFGYEKGSFPEPTEVKQGRFEHAMGGTIILDEISDMPVSIQEKLIQIIDKGEYERVNSSDAIRTDARIVACSTRELEPLVKSNRFLPELYDRLKILHMHLPPLRQRKQDIPVLINHFMLKYRQERRTRISKVTAPTLNYLMNYPWPGNVRELDQALRRSLASCKMNLLRIENVDWLYTREDDEPLETKIKPDSIETEKPQEQTDKLIQLPEFSITDEENVYEKVISNTEKTLFSEILQQCNGNVRKAARHLGISRTTLRTKLEKYQLTDKTRKRTPATPKKSTTPKVKQYMNDKPKPIIEGPLKITKQHPQRKKQDPRKKISKKLQQNKHRPRKH